MNERSLWHMPAACDLDDHLAGSGRTHLEAVDEPRRLAVVHDPAHVVSP